MKKEKCRNNYIDLLRGFAIVLMIFGHMIGYGLEQNICVPEQQRIFQYIHNAIYSFHMPLFFSLSGYALAISDNGIDSITVLWKRIKKEIVSLYGPYLSFVVLYWLSRFFALNFLGCQLAEPLETKMGEMVYLLVAGKALSWFLLSLLLVRIVFDIVLYLSDHYWCLGFFVLVAVISIFVNNQIIWYLSSGLYFSIGYIISRNKLCVCAKKSLYSAMIIGFMLSLGIGMVYYGDNAFIDLVVAIILSTIPILINPKFEKNYICEIGKNSMIYYISHGIVNGICIPFLYSIIGMKYNLVLAVVGVIFQLTVIGVVQRIVENKHLYWMTYFFYPQRSKIVKKYVIG